MAPLRKVARAALRIAGAAFLVLVVVAAVAYAASREVRYLARAAVEEALILARRRPIARMVADPGTDAFTRGRLELVLAARDFAAESLHLSARQTYTTYSRLRRDTLVLVLSASPTDRLAPYIWYYPIVGRVPYKGFFDRGAALAEAARLRQRGLDTYLRVSDAFSTLGWFNDPLLSTVVRDDSVDLAATVIHEILHNTVWVKGNVPFNESLADFVGYRGAERFFLARGDRRSAAFAVARWRDEIRLAHFYDSLAARLGRLYAGPQRGAALDSARERIFREARAALADSVGKTLQTIDGRRLAERPLNNAVVVAARLYRTDLDRFEALLASDGGDIVRAIADLQGRAARGGDPWATGTGAAGRP